MSLLLFCTLMIIQAAAHNITEIKVPSYGDPRGETELTCAYELEPSDPELHSVKWYCGNDEIFRYTPGQEPTTRTFKGQHEIGVARDVCDNHSCTIGIILPMNFNKNIPFSCEVSTEGPRFAIVKQTRNLTIAAMLRDSPVISVLPGSAQLGQAVLLNCTTAPASPSADIRWYINDEPEPEPIEPRFVHNTLVSLPDEHGLRSSWNTLKVQVGTNKANISLRCEATQTFLPLYTQAVNATLMITHTLTNSGVNPAVYGNEVLLAVCNILSWYKALSELVSKFY